MADQESQTMTTLDSLDSRLLDILVCPICKGPLKHFKAGPNRDEAAAKDIPIDVQSELRCHADKLAFPVKDGIARMLVDEARSLA
jgi:uncharacterized protein